MPVWVMALRFLPGVPAFAAGVNLGWSARALGPIRLWAQARAFFAVWQQHKHHGCHSRCCGWKQRVVHRLHKRQRDNTFQCGLLKDWCTASLVHWKQGKVDGVTMLRVTPCMQLLPLELAWLCFG
jgi:hypothetical protein